MEPNKHLASGNTKAHKWWLSRGQNRIYDE